MSGGGLRTLDLSGKSGEQFPDWAGEDALSDILASVIPFRRWFGSKSRSLRSLRFESIFPFDGEMRGTIFLCILRGEFREGEGERYFLPLGRCRAGEVPPAAEIAWLAPSDEYSLLVDGFYLPETGRGLLREILSLAPPRSGLGILRTAALGRWEGSIAPDVVPSVFRGEQSNTSLLFGNSLMLKGFRKLVTGMNPDLEVGAFLARRGEGVPIPATFGALLGKSPEGDPLVLALLQEFVPNVGDGWSWFLSRLPRVFSGDEGGERLDRMVERLGRGTARLHRALGSDQSDPDFAPLPFEEEDLEALVGEVRERFDHVRGTLENALPELSDRLRRQSRTFLSSGPRMELFLEACQSGGTGGQCIRCHGDFHLGQVLVTPEEEVVFLDFEGEPALPLALRRLRKTPLLDVAGMLRSLHYLSLSVILNSPTHREAAERWYVLQSRRYLRAYASVMSRSSGLIPSPGVLGRILALCLLRKALYELQYELDNRPDWLGVPLAGIEAVLTASSFDFGEGP